MGGRNGSILQHWRTYTLLLGLAASCWADDEPTSLLADPSALPFTDTTTVVQTTLPIITFGNELEDVMLTALVISADYNTSHVAPTSGLVMFTLEGGPFDGDLSTSVIGVAAVVPDNTTGIAKANLQLTKADNGIQIFPGDYKIVASYTGSKDGAFLASIGSTPMFVSILSFPVTWKPVDLPVKKLQQMEVLRDYLN